MQKQKHHDSPSLLENINVTLHHKGIRAAFNNVCIGYQPSVTLRLLGREEL